MDDFARAVEATLFAAAEPLSVEDIVAHAGDGDVVAALDALTDHHSGRGIELDERGVLWRLRVEGCRPLAATIPASALATPGAGGYVKRTEHDNTPYRFNMTQNGKRMTADDFDAWLQANGYSAGRRAAPAAAPAADTPQTAEPSQ